MAHLTGDPKRHDLSSFKDSLSGSCLCGSITVTIHDNELFTKPRGHLCHCANCRKVSGSVVSANLIMEEEKVDITDRDGTLKVYQDEATNSGNPVSRYFCAVDGKWVVLLGREIVWVISWLFVCVVRLCPRLRLCLVKLLSSWVWCRLFLHQRWKVLPRIKIPSSRSMIE